MSKATAKDRTLISPEEAIDKVRQAADGRGSVGEALWLLADMVEHLWENQTPAGEGQQANEKKAAPSPERELIPDEAYSI